MTQVKRAKDNLNEGEEKYRQLFENLSDAAFLVDLQTGLIVDTTMRGAALLGRSRDEIVGMQQTELYPPAKADEYRHRFARNTKQGHATDYEAEVIRKDGTIVPVTISPSALTVGGHRLVLGVFRDITERKRAEEALREQMHALGERVKELSCLYGISSLLEEQGISLEEVFQGIVDLTPPAWQYPEVTCVRIILDGQEFRTNNFKETIWKQTSDIVVHGDRIGTLEVCYLEEKPGMDEGPFLKEERSLISAVAERLGKVTERKRAEEALRKAEEKWRSLVENAPNIIIIADRDGTIQFTNHTPSGINVKDVIGRSLYDYTLPEYHDVMGETINGVFDTGEHGSYEVRGTGPDGRVSWYETQVGPIRHNERVVAVTLITVDVTERKRAEEALRQAKERLETRVQERTAELDKANEALRIDITERKRVEEELRESEERYRAIFKQAADAIVLIEAETGELVEFNDKTYENLGYSRKEFRKLKIPDFEVIESAEQVAEHIGKIVKQGGGLFETQHRTKSGEIRDIQVSNKAICIRDRDFIQSIWRDITERKRMEEALKKSEELSSSLLDNTPNPISVINPDTSIRYINSALEKLTGFSSAEVIGRKSPYPWWQKEKQQQYNRDFEKAMRKGTHRTERLFQRKNGEQFWVDVTSTAVTGDGRLRYFLSNWVDITERKQAEEALRRSEEGFRNIYEESPIGIELYDSNGRLITVNKACLDIFGVSDVAEVKGFNLFEDPNLTDEVKERLRKGKTVRFEAPFDFEEVKKRNLYNTSKSGTIHNEAVITPLGLRRGKPLGGYLFQVQDVTERKKVEQALRKSEENFRALAENANDGIIIIAGNGQLLYANRRAAEITGHSRRDISKIHISRHIHPDELKKVLHRLARRLSGKVVPRRYETLLVRKDGSTMPIELVGGKTTWHGEPTVLAIIRDISEQKQLRENMQFYITEVTKAQETERKRIARDLHDETAQSLSMLSLEIDALREEKGLRRGLGSRLEHLRVGVEQTLEGVRRFSKELRPSILDELGLIPALQIMVDEVNVKDNINSRMDIVGAERRLPPEMEVGLFRISQEALSNIRRHSQATEVKVKAVFTPQKVNLTIKDNGVGFVLPYKLGDFTSRGKLGLYGMMERARLLDSSLKIRTRPGKGTTISIETKVGL